LRLIWPVAVAALHFVQAMIGAPFVLVTAPPRTPRRHRENFEYVLIDILALATAGSEIPPT